MNQKTKVMKLILLRSFIVIVCLISYISAFSQEAAEMSEQSTNVIDSLRNSGAVLKIEHEKPEIVLDRDGAVTYLQQILTADYWKDPENPLRIALEQLVFEALHSPPDSAAAVLNRYPYDSLNIPWDTFYVWKPIRYKIPVLPSPEFIIPSDSVLVTDTSSITQTADSVDLPVLEIPDPFKHEEPGKGLKDTTVMIVADTLRTAKLSNSFFPFNYLYYPYQGDSMQVAVRALLDYLEARDSSVIRFTGMDRKVVPVWMNSKAGMMMRFWLKNEFSDSVTVWIGNPARDTIGLYLEQGITFRRPARQGNYSDASVNVQPIDNKQLLQVQKIVVKPQYWKYRSEAVFTMSQSSLSNWVKGGESSIATSMDLTGFVDYANKNVKVSSSNFARLKLGFLATGDEGIRKNLDLLETNSKLNHKAFGKFDFSTIMLFKTQVAPGYNYPNDSVVVSKFLNPAVLTIGIGLDYKPNKETSINFSPLSYKGTFVPDTAHIDQTKYGILKDKKSKNEPGASFMISNVYKPFKTLTITNRLQLFTNYIHNPLNVDIDWEMIAVANLNWFTDVRLNTHLIFDDDTKTVVLDKDKQPVKNPIDGTLKKTARTQFKEMIGFSFVFRF